MRIVVEIPNTPAYAFKFNQVQSSLVRNFKMANGHGGRRLGAGKPSGALYKPRLTEMREQTVSKLNRIVASEKDPLSVLIGFVGDENLDVGTRMNAASIVLPYLFPKLSEMRIDSKTTITSVDGNALLERISERIEKLGASTPRMSEPVIEAGGDDAGAGAGGDASPDGEQT